jgi:DNA modification methylase
MSIRLLTGDCRETLSTLPTASVQAVITSPPYYGLRDYGTPPLVWGGIEHEHEWAEPSRAFHPGQVPQTKWAHVSAVADGGRAHSGQLCPCGAWLGSLGLEPTPDLFVEHVVEVFREVRRVLRDDGVLWLNLGDSYVSNGRYDAAYESSHKRQALSARTSEKYASGDLRPGSKRLGLKPKDLMMMPFRVAMALQADGWVLRSVIPWLKRNSMPESVTDRPATAVEYVFLLSKASKYFWDADSVRVSAVSLDQPSYRPNSVAISENGRKEYHAKNETSMRNYNTAGRNRRNNDWFFESWQGLMLDEQDDPLALVVNPRPFSAARLGRHYGEGYGNQRKVSPNCPVHGQSLEIRNEQTAECGGLPSRDGRDSRSPDTANRRGPGLAAEPYPATLDLASRDSESAAQSLANQAHTLSYKTAGLFDEVRPETPNRTARIADLPEVLTDDRQAEAQDAALYTSREDTRTDTTLSTTSGASQDEAAPLQSRGIGRTQQTGASNSGYSIPPRSQIANGHNNESHRMGLAPSTIQPCTVSEQTPGHTDGMSASGESPASDDCDIRAGTESLDRNARSGAKCSCHIVDHFATFPDALVEPMIKASTSEKGQCPECGAPWVRVVERGELVPDAPGYRPRGKQGFDPMNLGKIGPGAPNHHYETSVTGWQPSCAHISEPVPQTVLDPFGGAGTVGLVADRLQRNAILCELKPEYADMGSARIINDAPMFADLDIA